ncbi:MAG: SDR family oxidoreductase, partial [Deltaproteobacteria bacterium]|nr:SDR family oxidoreductase [Deltaproteobacteria bacterium]
SGIGFAVAKAFQDTGASVHICDVSNTQLDTCRQTLPGAGISCVDISSPAEVDSLFEDILSHLGGLDVLVNNAGIAGPTAPIEAVDPEDWDRTMAVNINGQFYCARKAVPLLKEAGGGSIINMSSSAGIMGYPFRSPYAASKWAVIGLTKTMAMELGEFNVRVNAVCPNAVEGPRMDAVIEAEAKVKGITEEEVYACLVQGTSMRTFVTAEDVSNMILFLCSDAGKRISGQALSVDGFTETLR